MSEKNWWPTCTSLRAMLQHLRFDGSPRKKRLFGVACCRRVQDWLTDADTRLAVEVAERYADGDEQEELEAARKQAQAAVARAEAKLAAGGAQGVGSEAWRQAYNAREAANLGVAVARSDASLKLPGLADTVASLIAEAVRKKEGWGQYDLRERTEQQAQRDLLREIFGDPFHPVRLQRVWLAANDRAVVKLAQGIYAERAFDRMPILGDALEDAGCSHRVILEHCRSAMEHVRGCWLVDAILGRE
jgi:hypothetical protein